MRRQPELADLSPQDPVLLKQITVRPGIGIADLAQAERLRVPTITSHVKRLEAAGMIRRVADAGDRRRSGLYITAKGRGAVQRATAARYSFLAERLDLLSPEELATLSAAAAALVHLAGETAVTPPDTPSGLEQDT